MEAPRHRARPAGRRGRAPRAAHHRRGPREGRPRGGDARRRVHPLPVRARHRRGPPAALPGRRAHHERRDEHALARAARAVLGARLPRRGASSGRRGRSPSLALGGPRVGGGAADASGSRGARRRSARGRWCSRSAAFAWCAASGMEVVPFAWAIARAARRASEWAEDAPEARTRAGARRSSSALAWVGGALPARGRAHGALRRGDARRLPATPAVARARPLALAAGAAVVALPLLLLGAHRLGPQQHGRREAAPGQPVLRRAGAARRPSSANVRHARRAPCSTARSGRPSSCPTAARPSRWRGSAPSPSSACAARSRWRAVAVLLLALTMFAPCFYDTFLWNRLRYLWPFATGWFVGLACLARVAGRPARAPSGRGGASSTPVLCGVFVGDARDEARVGASTTSRSRRAGSTASRWRSGAGRRETCPPTRASASTTPAPSPTSASARRSTSSG